MAKSQVWGLLGNVTAGLGLIPIYPVGRYVYPAARDKSRIIFISRYFFGQESSIIASLDGLLIDSIDRVPILRILRTKEQQKKRIVFEKYSEHVGACTKSLAVKGGRRC